jgi:copper chaperone CopZ
MTIRTRQFKVNGMHCLGCEETINEAVNKLSGIYKVNASYRHQTVDINYDDTWVDETIIHQIIQAKGYDISDVSTATYSKTKQVLIFILLLAVVGGVVFWGKTQMPGVMQQIRPDISLALLFGIGFLTGFHCIGMCGGFVVGYTDPSRSKARQLLAHLIYGVGKTFSYTALGAGFGLLGAALAITWYCGIGSKRFSLVIWIENAQCLFFIETFYFALANLCKSANCRRTP